MSLIYLDNNATTIMAQEVSEAMHECDSSATVNPASSHGPGRAARRRLESCRDALVQLLGGRSTSMQSDRLLLTSGGTESNNLALIGMASARDGQVIISSLEHPSIAATADWLQQQGRKVRRLPCNSQGVTCLESLETLLAEPTSVVSVMWANNETGVIQPIDEIARICRNAQTPIHTDAVQALGKIPLSFADSGVSALTFNAHKLHGPRGVGGLLLRNDVELQPILHGGFQQLGLRPGTEPLALAVGMQTALQVGLAESQARRAAMTAMRIQFEESLGSEIEDMVVIGRAAARLPHTSCIAFPGVDRQALLMALDMADLACSTGSACASGSSEPSPTLQAMHLASAVVESALRFSLSHYNTPDEMSQAARRIVRAVRHLQGQD